MSTTDSTTTESVLPVDRTYDFERRVPRDVPEYIQIDNELDKVRAEIRHRHLSGRTPHFIIGGPTGCAKTHFARYLASETEFEAPLFTIQGKYSMSEADLLGMPLLVGEDTLWADGPVPRALLSSQERLTFLLIDEVNRARPEAKSALFDVLDDRCQVTLDARGGEIIEGDPENLVVIATMNEGEGYYVEDMDLAERRRLGNKFYVNYLGLESPEEEVDLVADRTPVHPRTARRFVRAANKVRKRAASNDSPINAGVPTATVINWAATAFAYEAENITDPEIEAAETAVCNPFYAEEGEEVKSEVFTLLKTAIRG